MHGRLDREPRDAAGAVGPLGSLHAADDTPVWRCRLQNDVCVVARAVLLERLRKRRQKRLVVQKGRCGERPPDQREYLLGVFARRPRDGGVRTRGPILAERPPTRSTCGRVYRWNGVAELKIRLTGLMRTTDPMAPI